MMLSILPLSERRYVLVETDELGSTEANLSVFTQGQLGDSNEMIVVTKSKVLTKKLDYDTVMRLYCFLVKKAPLTETQWSYILEDEQAAVERRYQKS